MAAKLTHFQYKLITVSELARNIPFIKKYIPWYDLSFQFTFMATGLKQLYYFQSYRRIQFSLFPFPQQPLFGLIKIKSEQHYLLIGIYPAVEFQICSLNTFRFTAGFSFPDGRRTYETVFVGLFLLFDDLHPTNIRFILLLSPFYGKIALICR